MIKRFKVQGHSMEPNFFDGDRVLINSLLYKLKVGDVVVFSSGNKDYLKRIKAVTGDNYVVSGDNQGHSRNWSITGNQIRGKFLMKY